MKVTVTEIFCEVITGLAVALAMLPVLNWVRVLALDDLYFLVQHLTLEAATVVLVVAYVIGVLFDSVGLVADRRLEKRFRCADPSPDERARFWSRVPEHVLAYRNEIWAYYFCYRNLLLLVPPAAVGWLSVLILQRRLLVGVLLVGLAILLELSLWHSAQLLLTIYHGITLSFNARAAQVHTTEDLGEGNPRFLV